MNVDNTENCPVGAECQVCSSKVDLGVSTLSVPVGILCMTVCERCRRSHRPPWIRTWAGAVDQVIAHFGHLGLAVPAELQRSDAPG
jgi:hypothetical protein